MTKRRAFGALNSIVKPLVKRGAGSPLALGGGLVVLETTGRRTGKVRERPLLATRRGDRLVVSTVRGRSAWLSNLEAQPATTVWLGGQSREATASVRRGPLNVVTLTLRDEPAA